MVELKNADEKRLQTTVNRNNRHCSYVRKNDGLVCRNPSCAGAEYVSLQASSRLNNEAETQIKTGNGQNRKAGIGVFAYRKR